VKLHTMKEKQEYKNENISQADHFRLVISVG